MKNKIIVLFLFLAFSLAPVVSKAVSFDSSVLKAVVQIQIWDISAKEYVSWGTGISMGNEFLTNYHVAKSVITDPSRYTAFACVTNSINTDPDCKLRLSLNMNFWDKAVGTPKYDQNADLAILYLDKVYVNGTWKSWMDAPLNEWGVSGINLNEYIKNYQDIVLGNHVYSVGYPDYASGKTIQVDGTILNKITDEKSKLPLAVSDFKISFGNSGGPVFNSDGKLVGVTVQCFVDSNDKCVSGIFIPLPTLNWWYTNATNSHIFTFNGSSMYTPNSGSSDEVMKTALCMQPLRQNAHYDQIKNGCSCNTGFTENSDGDCVDSTGYVDPTLRYGQKLNQNTEKNSAGALNQLISNQPKNSGINQLSTKANNQTVNKVTESKNAQNEVRKNTSDITNLTPTNSNTKVVTNTEVIKPKGFWTRLTDWLGF